MRCVEGYRDVLEVCVRSSNFAENYVSKTFFGATVNAQDELETLVRIFRHRGEFGVALRLSRLRLRGSGNNDEWNNNLALVDDLCVELNSSAELSSMHRVLSTQVYVVREAQRRFMNKEEIKNRITQCQENLNRIETRGLRSPRLALDIDYIKIQDSPPSSQMRYV